MSRPMLWAVRAAQGAVIFLAGVMLAQGATAVFGPHQQAQWRPVTVCQGNTAAAPCAVVTSDGVAVEWTTRHGD